MSPIPADEVMLPDDETQVERDAKQPKSRARQSAVVQQADSPIAEVSLPEHVLSAGLPILRARVVYLGPGEYHAVSMPGQISEEFFEDPDGEIVRKNRRGETKRYRVLKTAVDAGLMQYDFTFRDQKGDIIQSRLMPSSPGIPEKLRGKPFTWCEHVGHLRRFFLATDQPDGRGNRLYHVMTRPEHREVLSSHLKITERSRRQQDALFKEVVG